MSRLRAAHLVASAVALAAYPWLGAGLQQVVYLMISGSAVALVVFALLARRIARPAPWVLVAVAFGFSFIGDAMWTAYALHGEVPFPNPSDVPYLLFYPCMFAALAAFLSSTGQRDRAAWLDAMIWTVGAFVLAWEPLIEPALLESGVTALAKAVSLAYPMLDLGLVLMVLRIVVGGRVHAPAFWWLVVAMAAQTASDAGFSLQVIAAGPLGSYGQDLGYLLTYVAVGAAALHPSMSTLGRSPGLEPTPTPARLALLLVPTLAAPAVLFHQLITGQLVHQIHDGVAVAAATAVLMVLGVARAAGLLKVAERRSEQLRAALNAGEQSRHALHRRLNQDALTGLASRDRFVAELADALAAGARPSVAFLDLDDFKTVNDALGHDAGDLLLVEAAERLRRTAGPADLVARFGGDEFAVLVHGDVEELAEGVLAALRRPAQIYDRSLRLAASIGVATADDGAASVGDLLRRADLAMYHAKRAGGGWVRYRQGMTAQLRQRMDVRAQVVEALRRGEVQPWFQPVVDLVSGELRGFEALARWVPVGGSMVPSADWLPISEETGLIVSVDEAVSRAAIKQLAAWRRAYDVEHLTLSLNVSALTLHQGDLAEEILAMLTEHEVPPSRVVVEVTEGVLMNEETATAKIQLLRAAGVHVSIDDFGTGWSSLSYLQRFPVDELKLDCSFTADLDGGPGGGAIPAAVQQLARTLSLELVVEGVETHEQREELIQLGFDRGQGYLFGPARPAHEMAARLAEMLPLASDAGGALLPA